MRRRVKKKMSYARYLKYLRSTTWASLRKKVLGRDKYRCQICKSKKKLEVHHKTYKRIGKERIGDLITLCNICHRKIHNIGRK